MGRSPRPWRRQRDLREFFSSLLGLFGPTGVEETDRGRGIGAALLLVSLADMASRGYAYAVIGGAGSAEFYAKVAGAAEIAGSVPGLYRDRLNS